MAVNAQNGPAALWGSDGPDPARVYLIPIDSIVLPDLRVTSTFTPEQTAELEESLRTEGQKDPVKCVFLNGSIVLADGLNRILALRRIGVPSVKALIQSGSIKDAQIANIITARHRGKENAAQTAEVIADLIDHENMPQNEVMKRLGLSAVTFKRLYAIAKLPAEIKDHVKYGRLGIGSAYVLTQCPDAMKQVEIANQAVAWGYTEEQTRAAVMQALNPEGAAATQTYVFNAEGRPKPVYPKCALCGQELQAYAEFVYLCPDDKVLFDKFKDSMNAPAENIE